MQNSVLKQFLVLGLACVVLGCLNNLRPDAGIEWFRDWPAFSALQVEEEPEPPVEADTSAPEKAEDTANLAATTPEMVVSNQGISDISIKDAYAIYQHARDLTFWIDARDPELYEAGHIKGAQLLYLYEKAQYLDTVTSAALDSGAPALVVYCKGKDCTDSHHLAQDLQAMGFNNIFVYTGGYDEWYEAGYPVGGAAEAEQTPTGDAPAESNQEAADPGVMQAQAAELVTNNAGITDISLEDAKKIHQYGQDFTFWIDARDPELYAKGHITGSSLLYVYDQSAYLGEVEAAIEAKQPIALVVYCKGKECTDSHHLAQDLEARGYGNILVYKGGFEEWYEAGLPIEGELAESEAPADETTATAAATPKPRKLAEVKPPGMYLEHVVRDMIPFLLGMFLLIGWRNLAEKDGVVLSAAVFVGLFFAWAAYPKIANPFLFAKDIWNYDIVPAWMINLSALFMPALEILCALAVFSPKFRRGAGAWISLLLVVFIIAVSYNVLRGHEFNCGCTSTATVFTDTYLEGWNDKYMLILRDIGLLVMSALAWRGTRQERLGTT